MSDKLTPEELVILRQTADENNNLIAIDFSMHIAAVEAERDALAALVREVTCQSEFEVRANTLNPRCIHCGRPEQEWHAPHCLITRAWQTLAEMENKA